MEGEGGNLETLVKWASEIGISDAGHSVGRPSSSCVAHSLFVSHFPEAGGRGLAAARSLRRGELVLRVPKSALLTTDTLLKDQRFSVALGAHLYLSPIQILIVGLLYEMDKGRSSWWYPYLMSLPRSYDILATFGEFEKQALQVDDAIWAAEKATLKAELEWKEASALMKELNLKPQFLSFRAWLWASATISSRTLHIPWDEAGCLCPVGDLFNYAAPGGEELSGVEDLNCQNNASSLKVNSSLNGDAAHILDLEHLDSNSQRLTDGGFEEDVDAYCFYARRHYEKGEQVLLGYGTYTNLELLEHYGFLLNDNPNEKVFIPLQPEICSSNTWPKELMYIHQSGKPSFALLSALRIWATPRNQRRSVAHVAYSGSQLSAENEILVMRWISKNCNSILKGLPTSFEEDRFLLSAIDKMQDSCNPLELGNVLASPTAQIHAFLEGNGLQDGEGVAELLSSRKTKRALDRWRLAIQWRVRYKETLISCISYCSEVIDYLTFRSVTPELSA